MPPVIPRRLRPVRKPRHRPHHVLPWLLFLAAVLPASAAQALPEEPVLARVQGREIRRSDVFRSIEALPLGAQIDARERVPQFLEAVIREEALFQFAAGDGLAGEPALREELKALVVERLIARLVRDRIKVSEADLRRYYAENPTRIRAEHARMSQIVLATRAECEALLPAIDSAATFARLAAERSLDEPTRSTGGDMGWFMRGLGGEWEEVFFVMRPGDMRVLDSPRGCHIVRMIDHENPPMPPFEAVREPLRRFLEQQREVELLGALMARVGRAVRIERLSGAETGAVTPSGAAAAPTTTRPAPKR